MIARLRSWLAHRRRMRAAEEMEMMWICWYLFFGRLHEKPKAGMAEYRFHELVGFHKRMVR